MKFRIQMESWLIIAVGILVSMLVLLCIQLNRSVHNVGAYPMLLGSLGR